MNFSDFIAEMERRRRLASVALDRRAGEPRKAGGVLLASQYGLFDPWRAFQVVKANGQPDYRKVSEAPATRWDVCEVPAYEDIPAALQELTKDSNRALRLRALGGVVEDKSGKRIRRPLRGTLRAISDQDAKGATPSCPPEAPLPSTAPCAPASPRLPTSAETVISHSDLHP